MVLLMLHLDRVPGDQRVILWDVCMVPLYVAQCVVRIVVQWALLCAVGVVPNLACEARRLYLSHYFPYYYVYTCPAPHMCVDVYAYVLMSISIKHVYTLPYMLSHPVS